MLRDYFTKLNWDAVIASGMKILLIIALAAILSLALSGILGRLERRLVGSGAADGEPLSDERRRSKTVIGLLRQLVLAAVWALAAMIVLGQLGVEIGPILAGAGIFGLALGFGAQSLVRDFFAGLFMLLENQVRIGDVARVNGTVGVVEQLSLRTIVLRDQSGEVHIFPNGAVTSLSNLTSEWSAYVFEINVAYREDLDRVVALIGEVCSGLRADPQLGPSIIEDAEVFGVERLSDIAVVIKGRIKTRPLRQWLVGREFLRRLKLAFDAAGIETPLRLAAPVPPPPAPPAPPAPG